MDMKNHAGREEFVRMMKRLLYIFLQLMLVVMVGCGGAKKSPESKKVRTILNQMEKYLDSFRDGEGVIVEESWWTLKPLRTPEEEVADPFPVLKVEKSRYTTHHEFAFKGKRFRLTSWEEERRDSTFVMHYSDGKYIYRYYPIDSLLTIIRISDPRDVPFEAFPFVFSTFKGRSLKKLVKTKEGIFSLWDCDFEGEEGEGMERRFCLRVNYYRETSTLIHVHPERGFAIESLQEWALAYEQIAGKHPIHEAYSELKRNSKNMWVPREVTMLWRGKRETMLKLEESRIPINRHKYHIKRFETNVGISKNNLSFTIPAGTKIHYTEKQLTYMLNRSRKTSQKLLRGK